MKWLCGCCNKCWSSSSSTPDAFDDATALVSDASLIQTEMTVQPFYVPRRHSSYNTGNFRLIHVQPRGYNDNADSCSNSDEEDTQPIERGRCWSTVTTTNASEVASLVRSMRIRNISANSSYPLSTTSQEKPSVTFDKHILGDISESDGPSSIESPDATDAGVASPSLPKDYENYGSLYFTTVYDEQEEKIAVNVEKALELPKKRSVLHNDTFVKLLLTTTKKNYRVSRPCRKTHNPIYNEEFVISTSKMKSKPSRSHFLRLSVMDCDRLGNHDAIGHVIVPLAEIMEQRVQHYNIPLVPTSLPISESLGQVLLGLSYSAIHGRLTILVIKSRQLKLDSSVLKYNFKALNKDTFDTFVKVTLMSSGKKVKTVQSRVVPDSKEPTYGHKTNFLVPPQFFHETSIVITINVRGLLGRCAPLGRVIVGPYTETYNKEMTHWGRMLEDSTRSIVKWRNLYL